MRKTSVLIISVFLTIQVFCQWSQIGNTFYGNGDISLNSKGNVIAIGAYIGPDTIDNNGYVRVFDLIDNTWVQKGSVINSYIEDESFGSAVQLNSKGDIVAVGAPGLMNEHYHGSVRTYFYNGVNWAQLGDELVGDYQDDRFGENISLNSQGNILAISAYKNDSAYYEAGQVKIFEFVDENWVQLGNDLFGSHFADWFGCSISLNGSGNTIAIGAWFHDSLETCDGQVKIYRFDGSQWIQLGNDIIGSSFYDLLGKTVSLNNFGNIIAVSTQNYDGSYNGKVKVFELIDSTWTQLGEDIFGDGEHHQFGQSLSLNSEGNILAAGASIDYSYSDSIGYVKVFEYKDNQWTLINNTLFGSFFKDLYGGYSCLDSTGTILAVSAPLDTLNSGYKGVVYVYHNTTDIEEINNSVLVNVYPNPTNGILNIEGEDITKIEIIDISGKVITKSLFNNYSGTKTRRINLGNFKKGMFFIKVYTLKGMIVRKVILE